MKLSYLTIWCGIHSNTRTSASIGASRFPSVVSRVLIVSRFVSLNQQAEPGARVFFAGYYSYWMRPDLLQCRDDRSDAGAFAKEPDASSRWATLYTRGFHYVVIDKTSHQAMVSLLDQSMAPPWLDVTEILKTDELSVLKLSSQTHDRTVELGCIQRLHPAWDVTRVSWRNGRSAKGLA
jgi:hypothetical protein